MQLPEDMTLPKKNLGYKFKYSPLGSLHHTSRYAIMFAAVKWWWCAVYRKGHIRGFLHVQLMAT